MFDRTRTYRWANAEELARLFDPGAENDEDQPWYWAAIISSPRGERQGDDQFFALNEPRTADRGVAWVMDSKRLTPPANPLAGQRIWGRKGAEIILFADEHGILECARLSESKLGY